MIRTARSLALALAALVLVPAPAHGAQADDLMDDGFLVRLNTERVNVMLARYIPYNATAKRVRFVVRLDGRPVMVERFHPFDTRMETFKRHLPDNREHVVTVRRDGVLVARVTA